MRDRPVDEEIAELLNNAEGIGSADAALEFSPSDLSHLVSRLDDEQRVQLFERLSPAAAARLVQALPLALAGDVLRDLPPARAAAVLDELPSDDQADLLAGLGEPQAAQVLAKMTPAEADHANQLAQYAPDTAGGLMAMEMLAFPAGHTVGQVVSDLRTSAHDYAQYQVQYVYVLSAAGGLRGVLRLRDLLFHPDNALLSELPLSAAISIQAEAGLKELKDFFERRGFVAAPVVDSDGRLLGVVSKADLEKATADQAAQTFLRFGGIVFGEEFRSMPLLSRAGARLAWLAITMLLSFLAASVVGLFEATLAQVLALAVFLPVISGMSGNAGNQSIAVSMRELSLGLVRPNEMMWVLSKEVAVGLINGLTLGLAMMCVAVVWKGALLLGIVVGLAQMLSVLLAACLGGIIPLLLKRLGFDPAVASAPLLTTLTDATGFFLTLFLASMYLA